MPTTLYGVTFPYTQHRDGPSYWPHESNCGPGRTWWVCDGCGREVYAVPNGGEFDTVREAESGKGTAFSFHALHCKMMDPPTT